MPLIGDYIRQVMSPSVPKLPPRKGLDLDQPWHAADPIPAPEAVASDGESAWALWNEVSQQHEQKFAPTSPMTMRPTAPGTLGPGERAWAPTQPGGRAPILPARQPEPQPLFTLDAAMLVARKNNRVCPRPVRWTEFFAMLPPHKTLRGRQLPPAPATGPAWNVTPALTKRLCFREHIEWAERAGMLEGVMAFMQSMREDEWLHMGED
jgi:hypothetical protein